MAPDPSPTADRRDLRAIVADGAAFSVMVGLGETYVPAFALAAGMGEVVAGLAATLPMLAGAVFQLITPWAVRRLRSYRRWVVVCALLQAASFLPLVSGAAAGHIGLPWLAVSTIAYWSFGMATSPAWNAWVTSLVPRELRPRFFAHRSRVAQAVLFIAILAAGLLLQGGRRSDAELAAFAVIFAGAVVARVVSAAFIGRQSEAPGLARAHQALPPREIFRAVRVARSLRVLTYLLGMQACVNVAAPFFTPYMLDHLALSYTQFMLLTSAAFLARVAVLPLVGQLAEKRGTRVVLWWGAVGIVPIPALWIVSSNFYYLLFLQLLAGSAWAALEFATLLSFFEGIEDRHRTSVLSAFNLLTAVAIAGGALVGSQMFVGSEIPARGYFWIFAVSTGGRLAMLVVLRGVRPARRVVGMALRTLAVRPSAGAMERPILASLGNHPGSKPEER